MNTPDSQPVAITLESRSKPWWQSKTIIGAAVAILAPVLGVVLKAEIPQEDLSDVIVGLVTAAGGILAIYGRVKANTEIQAPRATRATPDEIARARRGGSFKGSAEVRLLFVVVLVIVALTFLFSGCQARHETYDYRTGKYRVMSNAEAKARGFSFLQRNAHLPWFYPFALFESLSQIGEAHWRGQ